MREKKRIEVEKLARIKRERLCFNLTRVDPVARRRNTNFHFTVSRVRPSIVTSLALQLDPRQQRCKHLRGVIHNKCH